MLSRLFSLPLAALLWLLHFLPLAILAPIGRSIGRLLYVFARRRRRIATRNIDWCFPERSADERRALVLAHFQMLGRSIIERAIFWWGSPERLNRIIRVEGEQTIHRLRAAGRPVILLAPHFVGLDAGGVAVTMRFDIVSIYAAQANATFNRLLYKGRTRFGNQQLLSRQDGARATVKAMKAGRPFYYLPDLNGRRRDSIFVPFFGIPAATITGLSRLAKAAGAAVVPCVTRMLPDDQGYVVEFGEAWDNFPTENVDADTARMSAWVESVVRTMPEQYYWVHRRFKTRPPGESSPY